MSLQIKTCTKCQEVKPLTAFGTQSRVRVDGTKLIKIRCRDCDRAYSKMYYTTHKKEHAVRGHNWNEANRERRRELDRERYARDPEAAKKRQVDYNRKRRALKIVNGCDPGITLNALYNRDEGICGICRSACERKDASLDHKIPLSKGGAHTWNNIQLAHFNCNARKGNRI